MSRSFPLTPRGSSAINTYDEYGKPGAANQDRFQYTGQAWIPELGLYYYKTRFYAPHLGRFMQTDRVSYASGPNLYAYVAGDPVNWTDPTGEFVNIVAGAVIGLGLDYASQVALNLASGKSGKDAFWTSINKHELIASAALGTLTGTGLLWAGATGTARFAPAYLRPIVGELANPIKLNRAERAAAAGAGAVSSAFTGLVHHEQGGGWLGNSIQAIGLVWTGLVPVVDMNLQNAAGAILENMPLSITYKYDSNGNIIGVGYYDVHGRWVNLSDDDDDKSKKE